LQRTAARGFADWGAHNNALVSLAHATSFTNGSNNINSNGLLHQNLSPYTTHTWTTTYVQRPYNTAYAPATMNMLQTPFHGNNHEKESGIYMRVHIWHLKMEYLHESVLCSGLLTGGLFLSSGASQLEDLGASAKLEKKK
jgi:hypothetical protein